MGQTGCRGGRLLWGRLVEEEVVCGADWLRRRSSAVADWLKRRSSALWQTG